MAKYYITNGDQYLSCSNDTGLTLGAPVTQAKRFKYENVYNTLLSVNQYSQGTWCVQKLFNSTSGKNYVITNADKFVGDNDLVVSTVAKARPFKTAADAQGYILAHGELFISFKREPIIVNENYEPVDTMGKRINSRAALMKIDLERKADVKKVSRVGIPKDMRLAVYKKDNGTCDMCGKPLDVDNFTVDHIVPLNRGGINDMSNYRCLCDRCNKWKGDSLDEELVTMLTDVGDNYIKKHPDSDMMLQFTRTWMRRKINDRLNAGVFVYKKSDL